MNQEVAAYFNKEGGNYSGAWKSVAKKRLSDLEVVLVRQAIEKARKNFDEGQIKTLDVGIGTGGISEVVLEYDVGHCGIDISQTMVSYCREKFKNNQKIKRLAVHDILNPLPDDWGRFDLVTAIRVLSYTPLWQTAIRKIYEAMTPSGVFIFTFPNRYSSMLLSMMLPGRKQLGRMTCSNRELRRTLKNIGFSECRITGLNKLLDTFYDRCNGDASASVLFAIENLLSSVFGESLFAREFYVTCKK